MADADPADANACPAMQPQIDRLYPDLRAAPRAEKKRFGRRLLEDALAGRLIERSFPRPRTCRSHPACLSAFKTSLHQRNRFAFQVAYATAAGNSIGSTIDGSSFSGLLTRVEIGHIRMGLAANGRINSRGLGSSPSQRA
jgi:hypothetical protein